MTEACTLCAHFVHAPVFSKTGSTSAPSLEHAEPVLPELTGWQWHSGSGMTEPAVARRCYWDEACLQAHEAERGVEYGTMKIDHPDTPFLYYDEKEDSVAGVYEPGKSEPRRVEVGELQKALGLIAEQGDGERFSAPKWVATEARDEFLAKRGEFYAGEAELAALSKGLPSGWIALRARSEPRDVYYYHESSDTTQWRRPVAHAAPA